MVAGAWVVLLAASPGNCLAISGLIDAEALMPLVDPVAAPTADPAGTIADGPVTFELGTFNGSVAQSCAGAAPMIDVPDVEQSVCVRPVPPGLACMDNRLHFPNSVPFSGATAGPPSGHVRSRIPD